MSTGDAWYADRLARRERASWKRILDVQAPYRRHLRKLELGFVLDVGCGVGRNLMHLGGKGAGVGVDHNPVAVEIARSRGLTAYTAGTFRGAPEAKPGCFDAMLLSHVVEHMREIEAVGLIRAYLDLVRPGGKIVVITPQEAGHRSDPTHVEFMDFTRVESILHAAGCRPFASYSFPFPRALGRFFKYNEFVVLAARP